MDVALCATAFPRNRMGFGSVNPNRQSHFTLRPTLCSFCGPCPGITFHRQRMSSIVLPIRPIANWIDWRNNGLDCWCFMGTQSAQSLVSFPTVTMTDDPRLVPFDPIKEVRRSNTNLTWKSVTVTGSNLVQMFSVLGSDGQCIVYRWPLFFSLSPLQKRKKIIIFGNLLFQLNNVTA